MMESGNPKILVATATFNEANNIREYIARVRATMGVTQDILVVDDNSPDGTSAVIREIQLADAAIHLITRPVKAGLGSAHKLMKVYAAAKNYDFLVTMDADLSHRPEEIPLLLDHAGENIFVIGSRYAPGGKCDYVGFRNVVSISGNFAARMILGIDLKEFTTSFRVFDVRLLNRSALYRLKSNGYSYFMEVVSLMDELGACMIEVPIHFKDRENDISKIPKSQVVKSLFNLFSLAIRRHFNKKPAFPIVTVHEPCRLCRESALLPIWPDESESGPVKLSSEDYNCSSIQNLYQTPKLYECLSCGLIQGLPQNSEVSVGDLYRATDDDTYLANFSVKSVTFRNAYKKLARFLPGGKLNVLDIGSYYGAFLEVIKAEGHCGCGIEPSIIAARYSTEVLGHTVINELFTGTLQFPETEFDVITSWDVIEHLEDPAKFLTDVNSILKTGGVFVCSTIIIDSLIARLLNKKWHWIIPMHLTYFKKHEIIGLLEKSGFEVKAYLNHTHYASISYAVKGMGKNKGPFFQKMCHGLSKILPDSIVVPIALGDVRMLVCSKKQPFGNSSGNQIQ